MKRLNGSYRRLMYLGLTVGAFVLAIGGPSNWG